MSILKGNAIQKKVYEDFNKKVRACVAAAAVPPGQRVRNRYFKALGTPSNEHAITQMSNPLEASHLSDGLSNYPTDPGGPTAGNEPALIKPNATDPDPINAIVSTLRTSMELYALYMQRASKDLTWASVGSVLTDRSQEIAAVVKMNPSSTVGQNSQHIVLQAFDAYVADPRSGLRKGEKIEARNITGLVHKCQEIWLEKCCKPAVGVTVINHDGMCHSNFCCHNNCHGNSRNRR